MLAGVDVAIIGRRGRPELIGLRACGLHSCTIEVLDQRGIADRFPVRYRKNLSLCPQLLLGDQALHEFGSFLLIGLNALVQEHFAYLRNRPLLVFSDPFDVLPQD
jgi:hypothetical protein